jgi:hypothetical protein
MEVSADGERGSAATELVIVICAEILALKNAESISGKRSKNRRGPLPS